MSPGGRRAGDAPLIGYACLWDRQPRTTWSGSAWALRQALDRYGEVVDVGPTVPTALRAGLKVAGMRREDGVWASQWRHSRAARTIIGRDVPRQASRRGVDVVVQVQDLAAPPMPYAVVQDLSYGQLLERHGERGVPHFRTLGVRRIQALRDRQVDIYARAAALLPMSEWLAESLVAQGVPRSKIHVVNPGMNATTAVGPVPERRTGTGRRLLFVGRDFDTKGGDQVVAAVQRLRREWNPAVELTVVGPPRWPLPGEVPEGVTYLGPRPSDEVGRLMDAHDLFVMPSRFEGFGIVFVEALARGLPVVGREACAMPEIIDRESAGRLVASEDAADLAEVIVDALSDDVLYRRCAERAAAVRAHYTWDRAAQQISDVALVMAGEAGRAVPRRGAA